jgi:hypothetical protein
MVEASGVPDAGLGGSGDYAHATTLAEKESALLQGKL